MADITSNLVHHWLFDNSLVDRVNGANFTGTQAFVAGKIGNALSCPSSTLITATDASTADFDDSTSFSVACWLYQVNENSATMPYVSKAASQSVATGAAGWIFYANNGRRPVVGIKDGTDAAYIQGTAGDMTLGSWSHWCFTLDRSDDSFLLYKNGSLLSTTPAGSAVSVVNNLSNTTAIAVGAATANQTGFYIDDFRIYQRALSATDVAALYAYRPSSSTLGQGNLSGIIGQPLRGRL